MCVHPELIVWRRTEGRHANLHSRRADVERSREFLAVDCWGQGKEWIQDTSSERDAVDCWGQGQEWIQDTSSERERERCSRLLGSRTGHVIREREMQIRTGVDGHVIRERDAVDCWGQGQEWIQDTRRIERKETQLTFAPSGEYRTVSVTAGIEEDTNVM